jgi:opacity protein-like surface antigen
MKKTIFLGAIALISLSTFAQDTSDAGITYGVKAGVTFPTFSATDIRDYTGDLTVKSITSFYVGGVVNIPVHSMLSVQPGLTLIGKGGKASGVDTSTGFDLNRSVELTPMYLEIPVNLIANFEAGPGKVFVGAGPYLSFGIGGKLKAVETVFGSDETVFGSDITIVSDIKFGTNSSTDKSKQLKSLDFGLNFLLGYQLTNGLSINGGYGLGLTNIDADSGIEGNKASVKNSVISVGLGFAF